MGGDGLLLLLRGFAATGTEIVPIRALDDVASNKLEVPACSVDAFTVLCGPIRPLGEVSSGRTHQVLLERLHGAKFTAVQLQYVQSVVECVFRKYSELATLV